MSTGLPVFDSSVQETNLWLKDVGEGLGHACSRHEAYAALRAVLHALRDRLQPEAAVHFAAQLTLLLRGLYFEGWRLAGKPTSEHTVTDFADRVAREFPPKFPFDPEDVVAVVFAAIEKHTSAEEAEKLRAQLPAALRPLWRRAAAG